MRLTCPNCDAQYEVDDRAIPEGGRDVQCSNCGHGWYQYRDRAVAAAPVPEPAPVLKPEPTIEDEDDEPPMVTSAAPVAARRRALNDNVRAVLQEEARRETEARKAEGAPIETQTELGLEMPATPVSFAPTPAPANRTAEAAAALGPSIMAQIKGYDAELEEEEARHSAGRSARRDLLPDIEEINSILRASSDRGGQEATNMAHLSSPEEQKRGFRLGFGLVLLIAVVLVGVYVSAPAIAQKLPAAKPFLIQYVDAVNGLRAGLDALIQCALGKG